MMLAIWKGSERNRCCRHEGGIFRNNGCLLVCFKCPNKRGVTTPNVGELRHFIKLTVSFSGDVYFLKLKILFLKLIILCRKCFPLQIFNKNTKNILTAKTKVEAKCHYNFLYIYILSCLLSRD